MKGKIVWLVLSCLMVVVLVLASCGPAAEEEEEVPPAPPVEEEEAPPPEEEEVAPAVEEPRYGGKLIQVLNYEPYHFDSVYGHHYLSPTLYLTNQDLLQGDWAKGPAGTNEDDWMYYSKITMPDVVTGCLAESFEFPDPYTLIFHIRKGVHWHDKPPTSGRELDAYDVEASFLRFYEVPQSFHFMNAPWDECFDSIEATDKWTVVVKFKNRSDGYAQMGDHSHVYPRDMIEEYGDMDDWENSCGTGPFILVDYVKGSSLTFIRNPNYWEKDSIGPGKGNQLPYVDSVKWLIITDVSTQQAALRTGKIDQWILPWEDAGSMMKTNPELKYYRYHGGMAPGLHFRVDKPELPSYDQRVRQALMMAIDNKTIAEQYYGGNAQVLTWPCAPVKFLEDVYVPLEETPEVVQQMFGYHPDKAKQLLAEAGYPNGFKTEICCVSGHVDLLSIVKDYWAKIGVDLQIDVREVGAWTSIGAGKKHEDMYYRDMPTTLPKDLDCLQAGNWLNYGMIDDPRIEEDCDQMDDFMILDEPGANAMGRKLMPYILEKCYIIQLPGADYYNFWQPWVKNYHGEFSVGLADAYTWAKYIWIDEDLKEQMTGRR